MAVISVRCDPKIDDLRDPSSLQYGTAVYYPKLNLLPYPQGGVDELPDLIDQLQTLKQEVLSRTRLSQEVQAYLVELGAKTSFAEGAGNGARIYGVSLDGATEVSGLDSLAGATFVLSTPTAGGAFAAYALVIDAETNTPRVLLAR